MTVEKAVYWHCRRSGYWWVLPEMNYQWRADLIAWGPSRGILEIEVKRSWSDYKNDALKSVERHLTRTPLFQFHRKNDKIQVDKYRWLLGDYPCLWRPTHFVYAAPLELAERILADPDRPKQFGVWGIETLRNSGTISISVLAKIRKLGTLTPDRMARFKKAAFERALWCLDERVFNL